ncbi:MAG: hypothetical protein L0220_31310 [Acidobacteria bacterium]|nr:hypothetical protein [Acidobacteriota bacterium]
MNIHDIGETPPENGLPESSGINPRPILVFLGILAVSTILVFVIIYGMLRGLEKMDERNQGQPASLVGTGGRKLPPEPRLQGAPAGSDDIRSKLPLIEMKDYREQVNKQADSYGYLNKEAGLTHIPLDRAKTLIVERGYPVLTGPYADELKQAATVRKQVLNAEPNAGRIIQK